MIRFEIRKMFLILCMGMLVCGFLSFSEVHANKGTSNYLQTNLTYLEPPNSSLASCKLTQNVLGSEDQEMEPQEVDCTSEAYGYNQSEDFFSDTLVIMGIPFSRFAVDAFMAWKPYENTAACWNPLATTRKVSYLPPEAGCTSTNYNSVGVKNYSSKYCGELATASTLNLSYYTAIRTMLRQEAFDYNAIRAAVKTWIGSDAYATSITNKWADLWNNRPAPDTIPPTTTLNLPGIGLGENGWYTSAISFSLSATDNSSGISYSEFSVDSSGWIRYSNEFTLSINGQHSIYYRSVDKAGNVESPKSATVNIDTELPLNPGFIDPGCDAESGVPQNKCNQPYFYWYGQSDSISGVAGFEVYWGADAEGTAGIWKEISFLFPPTVSDGVYYLRLRTKDLAGNFSAWETLFILNYNSQIVIPLPYSLYLPLTVK